MPDMLNTTLAKRRRRDLDLTLHQLAELVGVTRQVVHRWETGVTEPKNAETLRRYARALGVSPGELVAEPEVEPEVAAAP